MCILLYHVALFPPRGESVDDNLPGVLVYVVLHFPSTLMYTFCLISGRSLDYESQIVSVIPYFSSCFVVYTIPPRLRL
jgi:hypothetical protein